MTINLTTTKMSSKGQVVIPEIIRRQLGLKTGDEFIVVSKGDSLMLKVIKPPSLDEFKALQKELQTQARKIGLKQKDVAAAILKARGRNGEGDS
jgi:AbrB family looped-hinge helix DNA binding protein